MYWAPGQAQCIPRSLLAMTITSRLPPATSTHVPFLPFPCHAQLGSALQVVWSVWSAHALPVAQSESALSMAPSQSLSTPSEQLTSGFSVTVQPPPQSESASSMSPSQSLSMPSEQLTSGFSVGVQPPPQSLSAPSMAPSQSSSMPLSQISAAPGLTAGSLSSQSTLDL